VLSVRVVATERVFRLFDQRDGLPAGEVVRLAQDSRGFIWMGSFAGLVRYDGETMRPWAPERLNGHVSVLIAGPAGEVVVRVEPGREGGVDATTLYRIVPGGIEAVIGPDGSPLSGVVSAAFGTDGQLCATVAGGAVTCRLADGGWVHHTPGDLAGEIAATLHRGLDDSLLAVTSGGVWQLDAHGGRRKLTPLAGVIAVVPHPDGALFVSTLGADRIGRILRISGATMTTEVAIPARPIELAIRGDVVWASFDRYVAAIRPGEPPEVIGPEHDLPSGGPLLVDHEGSLWIGTFRGVMHMPEPETVVWTERDGLPSSHTRFVEVTGETMWIGTWQGLGRMDRPAGRWQVTAGRALGADRMCVDAGGRLWNVARGRGIQRHEPDRQVLYRVVGIEGWLGCSARTDGTLWLSTNTGIFATLPSDGPPARIAPNPTDSDGPVAFRQILQDGRGRLWVAANDRICQASADSLRRGEPVSWRCQRISEARGISALLELADGDLWLATDRVGVWRYEEGAGSWDQMPGSASLPSYSLRGLVLSADGGVWILGHGTVVRVRDDHEAPDGWSVMEQLTGLHGLPSAAAEHLVERPDESLWIATIVGLVHVPARARYTTLPPPPVELVDITVNGARRAPQASPLRLGADDEVELRFAALSYRDRGLLRHQYRLHAGDRWTASGGGPSVFRFPDLAPGGYDIEVRASLDGEAWTPAASVLSFEILPPWHRTWWALGFLAALAGALLYTGYRLRVAMLLRLERQRTRIAMDLHDEIGSGLGSINILAGLAAERTPPDSPQAGLVGDISDTAAELGASLGEIVWSLRSRSETLDGLVSHLSDRAVKLFRGGTPAFTMSIPDSLPAVKLPLAVRWNVSLIALEALHNAARHAGASRVELGLAQVGRHWKLWVADDGVGAGVADSAPRGDGARAPASGQGLENMQRRAAEIGADLTMASNEAGGVTVTLVFVPQGDGARP
jgi:signal transduction histidine kinase